MKIIIAKNAGYCFGVKDAVDMANDIANKEGSVYMLGDIVHNEKVINDLNNAGAKVVNSLKDVPDNGRFYLEHMVQKMIFGKKQKKCL